MKTFNQITYTCYKAAFFSLIKAPALALFVGFTFLVFNNSAANTFLNEARGLVGSAPTGKVEVCIPSQESDKDSNIYKAPCKRVFIDESGWKNEIDNIIRNVYWFSVLIGFLVWFIHNIRFPDVINLMKPRQNK
ncbi:hypothetical protein [Salmonella enterica]|uniref:hypothetical protein n=1 Tax=Salmonella enterica TaxID=28901 RepID=UPI0009B121C9|nr:hypothetical protein [Salmonella enterica]